MKKKNKLKLHSSKLKNLVTDEDRAYSEEFAFEDLDEIAEKKIKGISTSKDGFELYTYLENEVMRVQKLLNLMQNKASLSLNSDQVNIMNNEEKKNITEIRNKITNNLVSAGSAYNAKMRNIWEKSFNSKG